MGETTKYDGAINSVAGAQRRRGEGFVSDEMADPLFILAPPRSFSSVLCAMLGQHPQMHGLPETHLFVDETIERWWGRSSHAKYPMADGLLRSVAQLCF